MNQQARRIIVSHPSRQKVECAVGPPSEQGFSVDRVAVIGQDLRPVEQVIARRGYGRAAQHGAAGGVLPGVLIGRIFGLPDCVNPVVSGLLPALSGRRRLVRAAASCSAGGRRNSASVRSERAGRYDVVADEEAADEPPRPLAGPLGSVGARTQSGAWRSGRSYSGPVPI
ncbi:general stress protein [Streptomyces sp. NPDC093261]|uniref:general stress protein n=1 Tax=Streptomyces sp. NPDC093261 TaxID=3366037 RepID=UPI00382BEDF8